MANTQSIKSSAKDTGTSIKSSLSSFDSASLIESAKSSLQGALENVDYEAALEKLDVAYTEAKAWVKKHPVATFVGAAAIGFIGMKIFEKVTEGSAKAMTKAGKKILN